MATQHLCIKQTGQDSRHGGGEEPHSRRDELRGELQRYHVLKKLQEVFASMNEQAGHPLLDQRVFLQPQSLQCRYALEKNAVRYTMALFLREDGLAMVFSWRRITSEGILRHLYQSFGAPKHTSIKYELPFDASRVTSRDVREWFNYLFSGFRDSLKPVRKKSPSLVAMLVQAPPSMTSRNRGLRANLTFSERRTGVDRRASPA